MPPANPFSTTLALAAALALVAVTACGEPPETRGGGSAPDTAAADSARNISGRVYERRFVFTTHGQDSTLVVPIFFSARTVPGGVERSIRGWIHQDDSWEAFVREAWTTPPTRSPWRILPHGPIRLVVGEQDAVEALIYGAGSRTLEVTPGVSLVEWSGSRGETFLVQEATVSLSGQSRSGVSLDLSRARRREDPRHGDWAFLASGDSLLVVLSSPREGPEAGGGAAQGFGRLDFREIQWPEVRLAWSETRAFEPARRDVPTAWTLSTPTGDLRGSLASESASLRAEEDGGPVLPVDGLYAVRGTLRVLGSEYPVRGLFRHRRD